MEMLVSRDWLRRKIDADPDIDADAGTPIGLLESIGMFLPSDLVEDGSNVVRLKHAFGVLVRQLRRREQLSIDELAAKARIDAEELRQVEQDPHFKPKPRLVHQLALVFGVSARSLMKLSGATVTRDERFEEAALRFAAKSDDLSKLTRDEQRVLNEYVKFLSDQGG